jgi:tRNA-specific adenosine deaminase 1
MTRQFAEMLSPGARREVVAAAQKAFDGSSSSEALGAAETDAKAEELVPEPSRRDLQLVAINQAIPFVGFGIMDNAILILAGDAIDNSLGVMFGISTLCAAALGNIISDVAGVGLGTVIEDFCARLGIPQPNLTQAQRQLRSVRFTNQIGCAFGLIIGCVIGMFPLLFLDAEKAEKAKDEQPR